MKYKPIIIKFKYEFRLQIQVWRFGCDSKRVRFKSVGSHSSAKFRIGFCIGLCNKLSPIQMD